MLCRFVIVSCGLLLTPSFSFIQSKFKAEHTLPLYCNRLKYPTSCSQYIPSNLQPKLLFKGSLQNAAHRQALGQTTRDFKHVALAAVLVTTFYSWVNSVLWTPSRAYNQSMNTVGREYDAWAEEGILEYYWGEHIHLGYYNEKEVRKIGFLPPKKNFIQAKYDFIDKMMEFGGLEAQLSQRALDCKSKILDVGCGIGGTSRYLAKKFGNSTEVLGITLSTKQKQRAQELAKTQHVDNVRFEVMDALNMSFADNTFDFVWACESGEHMPDKQKYVEEMVRVLKPGGRIVIATWCQRDEGEKPFNAQDKRMLKFLYSEWTHPYFISINEYKKLMIGSNQLEAVTTEDWTKHTISSWLHSIWAGIYDPLPVMRKPMLWLKIFRDCLTLFRMHHSFKHNLMQYGMMTASKKCTSD